jgi:hypothetical protein
MSAPRPIGPRWSSSKIRLEERKDDPPHSQPIFSIHVRLNRHFSEFCGHVVGTKF